MNADAFRTLALAEIDAVYRLAHHLASRPEQADDLVQETYLRAFRSKADFQLTEHGVRPYLFKILHNALYTDAANRARQPELLVDDADAVDPRANGDGAERVDAIGSLRWDDVDERLKRAIGALPLTHRTVFLLCAVENLRYREIAEVVGVPLGTVMSRLHHARQLLSKQLADLAAEQRITVRGNGHGNGHGNGNGSGNGLGGSK